MFKKAVQRGRSKRGGEAYAVPYVEPPSDARTKLEDFFNILLGRRRDMTDLSGHIESSAEAPRPCRDKAKGVLYRFDRMSYHSAWVLQQALHEKRVNGIRPDTLLLLEHDPVFTLGRSTKGTHWNCGEAMLRAEGYAVCSANRGGSVTYHGPGQVVAYPILRLRDYCAGPKSYMRLLEEVIIRTLADWNIVGRRVEHFPGVWVGDSSPAKVAAMGVHVSRGVTMHGVALNVAVELAPFSHIVPCGLENRRVTSMAKVLGIPVSVPDVVSVFTEHFSDVFQIGLVASPIEMSTL